MEPPKSENTPLLFSTNITAHSSPHSESSSSLESCYFFFFWLSFFFSDNFYFVCSLIFMNFFANLNQINVPAPVWESFSSTARFY
jgi:hypothetical protein